MGSLTSHLIVGVIGCVGRQGSASSVSSMIGVILTVMGACTLWQVVSGLANSERKCVKIIPATYFSVQAVSTGIPYFTQNVYNRRPLY